MINILNQSKMGIMNFDVIIGLISAARNVLLFDNNVVKICDFGLANAFKTEVMVKKIDVSFKFPKKDISN